MQRAFLLCLAGGLALLWARCGGDASGQACPNDPPEDGTDCSVNGRRCEYGDDPRPSCRGFAECIAGRWSRAYAKCPALPSAECPAQQPSPGASCAPAICRYGDTNCTCSTYCSGPSCSSPTPHWICWQPPEDARCPRQVPVLGSSCGEPDLKCTYGTCGGWWHGMRSCTQGRWEESDPIGCTH